MQPNIPMWDVSKLRANLTLQSAKDAWHTLISSTIVNAELFWSYSTDGLYSVKSGYHCLHDSQNSGKFIPSTSATPNPDF